MLRIEASKPQIEAPEPMSETDDMVRVDFSCHPSEPVKLLDDWKEPPYCVVCGQRGG
jgi:hypothetical protein